MGKKKEPASGGTILVNGKPVPERTARAVQKMVELGASPCGVMHLLMLQEIKRAARKTAKELAEAGTRTN